MMKTHKVREFICVVPCGTCVNAQVFTTKGSYVKLLYKHILAHSHGSQLNPVLKLSLNALCSHSKHFKVSVMHSKKSISWARKENISLFNRVSWNQYLSSYLPIRLLSWSQIKFKVIAQLLSTLNWQPLSKQC